MRRLYNDSGQTLVVAVIVMMLLVLVGTLFVTLVSRNQSRAGRSRDVLAAQYAAEAGVHYADNMLRTSELGADWRPAPDNLGFDVNGNPVPDLKNIADNHPDFKWLRPYAPEDITVGSVPNAMGPTGGFTSFGMGEGRYLLRVSYNPETSDPNSKYIKIESVGRSGVVDEEDPTTWTGFDRLRRELTAYKPIGVTDYLRFVTNREKRSTDLVLGAPGFNVTYGDSTSGAPIRVNGNLKWHGDSVDIYLHGVTDDSGALIPVDQVEVAGKINHQSIESDDSSPVPVTLHEVINGSLFSDPIVQSSDSGAFTTAGGFYRDASDYPDSQRFARGIKRLEPPIIDANTTETRVPRYIALTRDSGVWIERPDGRRVNSGRYGWGKGVYIDNSTDLQPESESLFGGYTLRGDWMNPNNRYSQFWQGPYYVPYGVVITLNPFDTDGDGAPDITITRTDIRRRNQRAVWQDAAGSNIPGVGSTITMPYPVGSQDISYAHGGSTRQFTIDRNGVIYAEGNIRIRGMLAPGKQLTVVSGGVIYIDGNVLKYRDPQSGDVDQTSAISLLAKQYICLNTTQFVSLLTSTGPTSFSSDSGTGAPPYHLIITADPASTFVSSFTFGVDPHSYVDESGNSIVPGLFVRQSGQYGAAYIDAWLNRSVNLSMGGLLGIGLDGPNLPPPWVYGCGDTNFCAPGVGTGEIYDHKIWDLAAITEANQLHTAVGWPNVFEIALDQSSYTRNNYLLSAFTIQPLDIRVEAAMYAQDRSFFIIPGNWFNLDPTDVFGNAYRPTGVPDEWPFFGQPLDTAITINGAVTENTPASAADVGEWYSKWSDIPRQYGSSSMGTAHPGGGLTFLYDSTLGWPKDANGDPIRTDGYGRALPITPCLPVCESLIYYGEPS